MCVVFFDVWVRVLFNPLRTNFHLLSSSTRRSSRSTKSRTSQVPTVVGGSKVLFNYYVNLGLRGETLINYSGLKEVRLYTCGCLHMCPEPRPLSDLYCRSSRYSCHLGPHERDTETTTDSRSVSRKWSRGRGNPPRSHRKPSLLHLRAKDSTPGSR